MRTMPTTMRHVAAYRALPIRILLVLAVAAVAAASAKVDPRQPTGVHLSLGTGEYSMVVMWQTERDTATSTVEYGPADGGALGRASTQADIARPVIDTQCEQSFLGEFGWHPMRGEQLPRPHATAPCHVVLRS